MIDEALRIAREHPLYKQIDLFAATAMREIAEYGAAMFRAGQVYGMNPESAKQAHELFIARMELAVGNPEAKK